MPSISEISYSREETIDAIREYYQFLCYMYMDESMVQEPPMGGWESIPNGWKDFNKTDEVMELLRHLPYLSNQVMGAPDCRFMNWSAVTGDWEGEKVRTLTEPPLDEATIPPHIVSLTTKGEDGFCFLLDTELGLIYWHRAPGEAWHADVPINDEPFSWAQDGLIPEDQVEWRENCAFWTIKDFFNTLKHHFKLLEFVPFGRCRVETMWPWVGWDDEKEELLNEIRKMYKGHCWPDVRRFRKEDCLADIDALVKSRFPDFEDELCSV